MTKVVPTSIEIAAPPERVWSVLTDFPDHPKWNPFIRAISGRLQPGERLTVDIKPPDGKGMTFKPTVLVVRANEELRWKGKLLVPGILDGEHCFELEPSATGTHFGHWEAFSGILLSLMPASSFANIERGFTQMNEAIKRRAEGADGQ